MLSMQEKGAAKRGRDASFVLHLRWNHGNGWHGPLDDHVPRQTLVFIGSACFCGVGWGVQGVRTQTGRVSIKFGLLDVLKIV